MPISRNYSLAFSVGCQGVSDEATGTQVPRSAGFVARFTFEELCGAPLGPADYLALGQACHTVFVEDVPIMSVQVLPHDLVMRFRIDMGHL